jgi:chromosome segregation ATPase
MSKPLTDEERALALVRRLLNECDALRAENERLRAGTLTARSEARESQALAAEEDLAALGGDYQELRDKLEAAEARAGDMIREARRIVEHANGRAEKAEARVRELERDMELFREGSKTPDPAMRLSVVFDSIRADERRKVTRDIVRPLLREVLALASHPPDWTRLRIAAERFVRENAGETA